MPNFGKLTLTNNGINALVKAQVGNPIVFTKIEMGSGVAAGNYSTLNSVAIPQLSAEIVSGKFLGNTYTVEAHFTNKGLTEGFDWREIGLYMLDSNGNDVLFGYGASLTSDYIPATTSEIYSKHIRISVGVDDAQNVTIQIPVTAYVDYITFQETVNDKVDKEDGKGLSTNDYSDAEKEKLSNLEKSLEEAKTSINESIQKINLNFDNYATETDLDTAKQELNESLIKAREEVDNALTQINNEIEIINNGIGTSNISSIGDGTLKGAIVKLYEMISSIPSITSGTTEPTGGKDGDVYIMHE